VCEYVWVYLCTKKGTFFLLGFTSEDGEEEDEDCSSEFADSAEDEERSKLTAQSLLSVQVCQYSESFIGLYVQSSTFEVDQNLSSKLYMNFEQYLFLS